VYEFGFWINHSYFPDKGPRHTKDVQQWYQLFPCSALKIKRETLPLSKFSNSK